MLVARDASGDKAEASRDLPAGEFTCPTCAGPVLLKRGRVKVAHFAHLPGSDCWSEPESVTHLRAKQLLAARFRSQGYEVNLEEVHHRHGRRVDVAVTVPARAGSARVAVEIQDSAISVEDMKARTRIDRRVGFLHTLWVFTDHRAQVLLDIAQTLLEEGIETRVPREFLWVDNRHYEGIFVLDVDTETVWNLQLHPVQERESYDQDAQPHYYTPRTLKHVTASPATFTLSCRPGRYDNEWAVIFTPSSAAS
ncbi:competence protein CoiA [Nocardia gipuzkoensis]